MKIENKENINLENFPAFNKGETLKFTEKGVLNMQSQQPVDFVQSTATGPTQETESNTKVEDQQGVQNVQSSRQSLVLLAAGKLREGAARVLKQRKPWNEVFDKTAFERPTTLNDATARLRRNVQYFRVNYLIVVAITVLICFLMSPSSLFILCALLAAWIYAFIVRAGPIVIAGKTFSERDKLIGMGVVSFVLVFFLTSIASVLLYAVALSCIVIALHGSMRQPEDLFLEDQQV